HGPGVGAGARAAQVGAAHLPLEHPDASLEERPVAGDTKSLHDPEIAPYPLHDGNVTVGLDEALGASHHARRCAAASKRQGRLDGSFVRRSNAARIPPSERSRM